MSLRPTTVPDLFFTEKMVVVEPVQSGTNSKVWIKKKCGCRLYGLFSACLAPIRLNRGFFEEFPYQ